MSISANQQIQDIVNNFDEFELNPVKKSILDNVITTVPKAPRITLYGKPGVGKTTLASTFPDPLFILTEENECPGISALPLFESYDDLWNALGELLALDAFPFQTIVIDTVSKLDQLILQYTLKKAPPIYDKETKSNRQPQTLAEAWGGYGSGFEKAASLHRALKARFDKFKDRGITVVFIAHSEIKKYKSPESDDYDIISIAMNSDKSRAVYVDDVDAVLYCKVKSFVMDLNESKDKTKTKKIVKSSGSHVVSAQANDVHVSKNRYRMPDEIPMTFEAIAYYMPFYNKDFE